MHPRFALACCSLAVGLSLGGSPARADGASPRRPNIVLLMSDDQGWGETGYNGHPVVRTPVLDEMAAHGLRCDRFYAAASVCSPTRASVLTGRHPVRSGVFAPNFSTRPEEITVAQILKRAGYRTGHFGKWHVGAVKADSPLNPARLGFDEYLSHDNFFEIDPVLSHNGAPPHPVNGEGSQVIVDAAVRFVREAHEERKPFFAVVWFGSPHRPFVALPEDLALYAALPSDALRRRFAEITAMDRAIGVLRQSLRDLGVADDTLVWFHSDNGISVEHVPEEERGGLYNGVWRGTKAGIYEGSFRVPCVIEWPAVIRAPRITSTACVTSDILPTLLDLLDLPYPDPRRPLDGTSLANLLLDRPFERPAGIGFWSYGRGGDSKNGRYLPAAGSLGTTPTADATAIQFLNFKHPVARTADFPGRAAWTEARYKLIVTRERGETRRELYDLSSDPGEKHDLAATEPALVERLTGDLEHWQRSVERSLSGADYTD